ncbi:MAG: lytic transglycosylase domain-containing protein [Verrucomicrobia bacterium]|nr:lytic transglycosylase domain-containing protein [Verrucomicrobiota bacterium]MCG2680028.1 lytic transglycosylase domain-containing protein [Kiritimatiellia bacterium]MBU4247317.1 lytic transglycosylase domain-containing protein [Verrucomicrobiota bacterium]MBU4291859.1 lytic transglycosylase domain-containing protein [Verrucomicrobiota bacterium]MBU4428879.1 lytic transglycosylase domain-containing protein [Verrucomicrobiota bacterium]
MRLLIIGMGLGMILELTPLIFSANAEEVSFPEEWFAPPHEWSEADFRELQDTVSRIMPQVARLADEREWNVFWTQVESVLQSQSLGDIAWLMPSVDMAYEYVNSLPDVRPLADWLKQRRDYFDMAGMAVQQIPESGPAGPGTTPDTQGVRFQVPAAIRSATPIPEKPRPVSALVLERRLAVVRSQDAWKTRLQGRSLPQDAQRLVPQLKKVFATEGTPQRWVWVAEVESSLNPDAKSPVGAVGLFQLMPETAKRFGLKTFPFDDRVKPSKNARAAAQYLKILYQQFGSWSLALAAYNAGEGRVGRAMKKHGAKTFDDVAKHLPLETQMYVPKVMATVALREDQANGVPYARWIQ